MTHEHYLQVALTTIQPLRGETPGCTLLGMQACGFVEAASCLGGEPSASPPARPAPAWRVCGQVHNPCCAPRPHPCRPGAVVHGYEYTLHSHTYEAPEGSMPMVRFQYDVSPVQIMITEYRTPFYKFVTSLCAIVGRSTFARAGRSPQDPRAHDLFSLSRAGGVFTVMGMLDGSIYALKSVYKKMELGKLQ